VYELHRRIVSNGKKSLAQRSQRTRREEEIKETEEAFEGDYMDYRITWIEALSSSVVSM
jgi:hypothetical protein